MLDPPEPPTDSTRPDEITADSASAQRWGAFTLVELIRSGTSGDVYRAVDERRNREFALRLLPARGDDAESLAAHLRDARLLTRVRDPHVVTVHGADEHEGRVGVWMDLVRGRTLSDRLKTDGPFSAHAAAAIGVDVCKGLSAIHDASLVHGHVAPRNVVQRDDGRTMLMEAGVGRSVQSDPRLLAPEVLAGSQPSPAGDIYSLGAVLFHLVTDRYPADGNTAHEVQAVHANGQRRRIRDVRPDLPEGFTQAVERALEPDTNHRFHSAGGFEVALLQFLNAPQLERRFPWRAAGLAAALTALLLGGIWYARYVRNSAGVPTSTASSSGVEEPVGSANTPTYEVEAALQLGDGGADTAIAPPTPVSSRSFFALRLSVSTPSFVYVVKEIEGGDAHLVHPMPGQPLPNPLRPGDSLRLPGPFAGQVGFWLATDEREHLVMFVNPQPLEVLERVAAGLPPPAAGVPLMRVKLSADTLAQLRALIPLGTATNAKAGAGGLAGSVAPLTTAKERAQGLWVRRLTVGGP